MIPVMSGLSLRPRATASRLIGTAVALLALALSEMRAQAPTQVNGDASDSRLLQFSVGGGFSRVPSNPLSRTNLGYNLQASLGVRTPVEPLRLRVDGLVTEAGVTRMTALTASASLSGPVRWSTRPYLLAGVGGYSENSGKTTAGFNVGLGADLRVGKSVLFMESRFHGFRDAAAGQGYLVPNGVVKARRDGTQYLWNPVSIGFRF